MPARHAIVALCVAACTASPSAPEKRWDSLRVSTAFGLTPVTPDELTSGAAMLQQLVYLTIDNHLEIQSVDADKVVLRRKPKSRFSIADLAHMLRHPDLKSAKQSGHDTIQVSLRSMDKSRQMGSYLLDAGPFTQEMFAENTLTLRRRSGHGIEKIEVKSVANQEEEWRRFLGREVDVVPYTSTRHARFLAEVPSVRLVSVRQFATVTLIFRVAGSQLGDVRRRRALSLALRRRSISQAVNETPDAAVHMPENLAEAKRLLAEAGPPGRLTLLVHDSQSDLQRASLVIQQQLGQLGIDVRVLSLPFKGVDAALKSGAFDMWLSFASFGPRNWYYSQTGD